MHSVTGRSSIVVGGSLASDAGSILDERELILLLEVFNWYNGEFNSLFKGDSHDSVVKEALLSED